MNYISLVFCLTVTTTMIYSMGPDSLSTLVKASEFKALEQALEEDHSTPPYYLTIGNRLGCPHAECAGLTYSSHTGIRRHLNSVHHEKTLRQLTYDREIKLNAKTKLSAQKNRYYHKMRAKHRCPLQDPDCEDATFPYPSWVQRHMQRAHGIKIPLEDIYILLNLPLTTHASQETEIVLQPLHSEEAKTTIDAEKMENF